MARIKSYDNDPTLQGGDKWIGTDVQDNSTKNFTLDSVASYFELTGKSDPSRLGFGYDFTTGPIGPGQFSYTHSDNSAKPSNVIEIRAHRLDRNGMDMQPMLTLFEGSIIRVTDVGNPGSTDYANFRAGQAPVIDNDIITITVSHVSSSGDLTDGFATITLFGTGSGGGAGAFNTIHSGDINPNGRVHGEAGDYYIRRFVESSEVFYEIFGPIQATGDTWGTGTVLNNRGPIGPQGNQGIQGPEGPQGEGRVNVFGLIPRTVTAPTAPIGGVYTPGPMPTLTGVTSTEEGNTITWTYQPPQTVSVADFLWETETTYDPGNGNALGVWLTPFRAGGEGPEGPTGPQGDQGIQGPGYNNITSSAVTPTGLPVTFDGVGGAADVSITVPRGPQGNVGGAGPQGPQGVYRFEAYTSSSTLPTTPRDTVVTDDAQGNPTPAIPTSAGVTWSFTVPTTVAGESLYQTTALFDPSNYTSGTTVADWSHPFVSGSIGPQGPPGTSGAAGADGRTVRSGNGSPNGTVTGNTGDFYIDLQTYEIYGPKVGDNDTTWPANGISLQGADGRTILHGTVDPVNSDGVMGDFFINITSNTLFGPKGSTSWPTPGTALVGPTGPAGMDGRDGRDGTDDVIFIVDGTTGTAVLPTDIAYWEDSGNVLLYFNSNTATGQTYTRAQIQANNSGFVRLDVSGGANAFVDLSDTPGNIGTNGQLIQSTGTALEFIDTIDTDQIADAAINNQKIDLTAGGTQGQLLSLADNNQFTWVDDGAVRPFTQADTASILGNIRLNEDYVIRRDGTTVNDLTWQGRDIVNRRFARDFNRDPSRYPLNSMVLLVETTTLGPNDVYPPGLYRVFSVTGTGATAVSNWERMSGFQVGGTDFSDHPHFSNTPIMGDHITAQWQAVAGTNEIGAVIPFRDTANAGTTLGVNFFNTSNELTGTVDASDIEQAVDPFRDGDRPTTNTSTGSTLTTGEFSGYVLEVSQNGTDFDWNGLRVPEPPTAQSQTINYELQVQANGTVTWIASGNQVLPMPTGLALATVPATVNAPGTQFRLSASWAVPTGVTVTRASFINVGTNTPIGTATTNPTSPLTSDQITSAIGDNTYRVILTYSAQGTDNLTIHSDRRVNVVASTFTLSNVANDLVAAQAAGDHTFNITYNVALAGTAVLPTMGNIGTITGGSATFTPVDIPFNANGTISVTDTFALNTELTYTITINGVLESVGGAVLPAQTDTTMAQVTGAAVVRGNFFFGGSQQGDITQLVLTDFTDTNENTAGTQAGPFNFTVPQNGLYEYFIVDSAFTITSITQSGIPFPPTQVGTRTINAIEYRFYRIASGIPGTDTYTNVVIA